MGLQLLFALLPVLLRQRPPPDDGERDETAHQQGVTHQ
jgi:hypothetical protein